MCAGGMEGALLSAAIGGAGMLMQNQSQQEYLNNQRRVINAAEEENSRLQARKADTITDFAKETFDPTTRSQAYEDAATKNESVLKDALLSAQGGEGQIYQGTAGQLSSDYGRAKAEATSMAGQDIMNRTRLLARSNANGLLGSTESIKAGQLASDVMGINSAADRNNSATKSTLGSMQNTGSVLGGLLTGFAKDYVSQNRSRG